MAKKKKGGVATDEPAGADKTTDEETTPQIPAVKLASVEEGDTTAPADISIAIEEGTIPQIPAIKPDIVASTAPAGISIEEGTIPQIPAIKPDNVASAPADIAIEEGTIPAMKPDSAEHGDARGPADKTIDKGMIPQFPAIKLPTFEGSGQPWLWIQKLEVFFALYRIPFSQWVDIASMHLRGKAETWFDCMMQERMTKLSLKRGDFCWDDFIDMIFDRYVAENLDVLKKFKALNQYSCSVQEYQYQFEDLLCHVIYKFPWYEFDQIVSKYMAGLTIPIRHQVQNHSPTTLARAFELAKLYESLAAASGDHADNSEEEDDEVTAVISPLEAMKLKERNDNGKPVVIIQSLKPTTKMETWIAAGVTLPSKRPLTIMYDKLSTQSFIDPKLAEECGFTVTKADQPLTIVADLGKRVVVSDSVCMGFNWELDGNKAVLDMGVLKLKGGLDMILGTDIQDSFAGWLFYKDENGHGRVTFRSERCREGDSV